jgi:hypothetical protein
MKQGDRLARIQAGRGPELQHRKAEGAEGPRLDQAETKALEPGQGLGTIAQHHHLAGLEATPTLMTGIGPAGWRAAAGGGEAGPAAILTSAVAVTLAIPVAVAVSLAVPVPMAVAVPIALAPVTVPAIAPITVATAIAVSAAIAVPVAVSVALAALAASAIPVAIPMVMAVAVIGERRCDEADRRIDRREAGADEPEREQPQGRGG